MKKLAPVALLLALAPAGAGACTLEGWSASVGTQGLSAGSPADGQRRFQGRCALRVEPGSTPRFVQDDSPQDEPAYLARFYVLADGLRLSGSDWVDVLAAYPNPQGGEPEFTVRLEGSGEGARIGLRARDGGTMAVTRPVVLGPGWHSVEVRWSAATGPSNGEAVLYLDGDRQASLNGLDNRERGIEMARLGSPAASGAGGHLDLDAFVSHRESAIGPLLAGDASGDNALDAADLVMLIRELNGASLASGQPDCNADGAVDDRDLECLSEAILRQ